MELKTLWMPQVKIITSLKILKKRIIYKIILSKSISYKKFFDRSEYPFTYLI